MPDLEHVMTTDITILDPTAPSQHGAASGPWRLDGLKGKVVGFIDNAKPNFDHLADEISALLVADHGVARVVKQRKRAASIPAATAVLEALTAECDLVITGSGD